MHVLVCLPPARISHELELLRAMPDARLTVVSDGCQTDAGPGAREDDLVVLPARRVPVVGGPQGWTAAPAWLRGLGRIEPDPVDAVVSLELFSFSSAQARGLARRLGVPHVVTVFETLASNPLYRLPPWRSIARRVAASATCFVCFTELAAHHAVALGCPPSRCKVVRPGVDTTCFHPPSGDRPSPPLVLFVGMLRADRGADKGVAEVVEACRRLAPLVDGVRLRLVGEGPLAGSLSAAVDDGTFPFLELAGKRPRSEVAAMMRYASVVVLASRRTTKWEEQFAFVLAEAMASGLPVVATRCGAIPEVVPDWNPLVVPGDVDGLVAGLRIALSPQGEELGRRNRAHALEHLDLATQGRAMAQALSSL